MNETELRTTMSWLKPLKVGMKIRTLSSSNVYANQTMTIVDLSSYEPNPLNNHAILRLERKVKGRRLVNVRFWWIYQNCELVE